MDASDRLRRAISSKYPKLTDFSDASGVNYRTLQHYLSGQRTVSTDFLELLTNDLGVSASWVLTGRGPMLLEEGEQVGHIERTDPDFISVPRFAVEASAGHGSLVENEETTGFYAFNRKWLARRGLNPDRLAIISVKGDSMEPGFCHNDLILVDQAQDQPTDGQVFVFRLDKDLFVKHVQRLPDRTLQLISANKLYPPIVVDAGTAKNGFQVIGRVVASMHEW